MRLDSIHCNVFGKTLNFILFLIIVLFLIILSRLSVDNINVQRLNKTLAYLKSKQRELKKQTQTDTRSLESMIKYLKKDMLEQFKLHNYDIYIKDEISNTETFIQSVQSIIDSNSQ